MKGKEHLFIGVMIATSLIMLYVFQKINPLKNFSIGVIAITVLLFLLGSILPDSDSENKQSFIFVIRKYGEKKKRKSKDDNEEFFAIMTIIIGMLIYPIALITNFLEIPIMKIIGKEKRGHKDSLHTIAGILIVSLFWVLIFYLIYFIISKTKFNFLIIIIWLLALFLGQFFHLIEDYIVRDNSKGDWTLSWK